VAWGGYGKVTALRMGLEIGEMIVTAVVTDEREPGGFEITA
jgi:hypothetical protein